MNNIATTEIKKEPKNIEEYYESLGVRQIKTDTKSETVDVSEPLISPVPNEDSPSPKVIKAGRLYQFSTHEKASGEIIFGNIFEIGYQRESDDLIVIRKKLWSEINRYEKDRDEHKEETAINEIIDKAIDNIKNLYIWKLEEYHDDKVSYIRKIKLCNAEDLLKTYKGVSNAKKPK